MSHMDYKVTTGQDGKRSFINIYYNNKRYRLFNGKSIGINLRASENLDLLKSAFELKLMEGWRPQPPKKAITKEEEPYFTKYLEKAVSKIQNGHYSPHHKRDCRWVLNEWLKYAQHQQLTVIRLSDIKDKQLKDFIAQDKWSARTQKNVLTTLKCLITDRKLDFIKVPRTKSVLHKPIKDVHLLLTDIKEFSDPLYISCLLTYGCLLRPHQEIRLLKWSDIDFERNIISLSGNRNKSGRNRIVPLPTYIKSELQERATDLNNYVLRDHSVPYSPDYLKVLWRRYKHQSDILEDGITLYSFRHSGAIKVFEKTGSLQKLQQVMGHSDMKVSLTYLRGLEVKQLDVEDLPNL